MEAVGCEIEIGAATQRRLDFEGELPGEKVTTCGFIRADRWNCHACA